MDQSVSRSDVAVYVGPGVPRIFEDAYAVNVDGTLKVWRWSTRQQPKRHPISEYAPGCWEHYEHQGEQGDEVTEPKQPEPPRPAAPRRATRPARATEVFERAQEALRDDETCAESAQPPWTPDPAAEREAEIRSREPGAPENLQPAVVRPSLPPRDFAVPTHQLPQRTPVRAEQPEPQAQRPARRGRTRGSWPRGGGVWLAVVTAFAVLAAIH